MSAEEVDQMTSGLNNFAFQNGQPVGKSTAQRPWSIKASPLASNTLNPIRNVVEKMNIQPNPDKPLIPLSIGDPTVFGNLNPSQETLEALIESAKTGKNNGYFSSVGTEAARTAVAEYSSIYGLEIEAKDVILTSGASHALDMCIGALASPGQNILVPRPGFPLYQTLSCLYKVETKFYNLKPDSNWEVDLDSLEEQIDDRTAAIVYNNPSNPCGSVFSKEHIEAILQVAERHRLPIIADEIYEDVVFTNCEFYPVASLTSEVPVLSVGGLTKKFLVPGWRLGWLIFHDRHNRFGPEVRQSLINLSQRIVGPNSIVQGAVPAILSKNKQSFYDNTISVLQRNAELCYEKLKRVPGLFPIMPQGAMYIMVRIDMEAFPAFDSDLKFVERLVNEESVFCLPGKCFDLDGYMRIVLSVPETLMAEAVQRIGAFCTTHYSFNNPPSSLSEEQRRFLGRDKLPPLNLPHENEASSSNSNSNNNHKSTMTTEHPEDEVQYNRHLSNDHVEKKFQQIEQARYAKGSRSGGDHSALTDGLSPPSSPDRGPASLIGTPESKTI